jgi:hypothetical protein
MQIIFYQNNFQRKEKKRNSNHMNLNQIYVGKACPTNNGSDEMFFQKIAI